MHLRRRASAPRSRRARLPALVAFALGVGLASGAHATDEKEVCVRAVERAQVARLEGKLREARGGFMTCARPVCPDAIRTDCTRWVGEVDASMPSVVFDAVWEDGRDVTGLKVLLDGEPLAGAERGRAMPLDPGAHTFRFEVAGAAPVETKNVIREGEKNRILHVTFAPVPAGPLPPSLTLAPPPVQESATPAPPVPPEMWQPVRPEDGQAEPVVRRPIPGAAYALGGFALVGLGAFAYLGLSGTGQLDSLRATCVHSCNPSDVSSARNEILAGDVVGFVALAAAGVAAVLVLTRPTVEGRVSRSSVARSIDAERAAQ